MTYNAFGGTLNLIRLDFILTIHPKYQGCGLGLDVSVSRRSRDVPTSRLGLVWRKIVKSRSRLGLGHLRLVPKTNFRPNCAGHSTQCELSLNVVSRCVVTIAHHINTLKTMNVKDDI